MAVKTDLEHLDELRQWRDAIVAALKAPETASAYGGMPDAGGLGVKRIAGRAELLAELQAVEDKIAEVESRTEDGPHLSSTLGVT